MDLIAQGHARTAAVTAGLLPESVRVPADRLALRCLVWGRPADPTLVLLHGNGAHAHWWDVLVPRLVPGWRVIAPDLRGHGQSDWTEPPRYKLWDFAEDLTAILGALAPGRVVLGGHSMGGRLAAWYAASHAERVRGLALLDTRLGDVDPEMSARWRGSMVGKREGKGYPTREAALAAFRFVPEEPGVSRVVIDDLAHHAVVERAPGEWTFRFDRAVLALDGDGAGDITPMVERLRCPVLALAGDESWVMTPEEREALVRSVPRCRLEVVPGRHHFVLAQPGPVGTEMRAWLDGLGQ